MCLNCSDKCTNRTQVAATDNFVCDDQSPLHEVGKDSIMLSYDSEDNESEKDEEETDKDMMKKKKQMN